MTEPSNKPVVVYDGECSFCQRQVDRIRRRDEQGQFACVPRQTAGLEQTYPALAEGDFNTGMRLITPDGRVHVGADAMYQIARSLPGWRRLAWMYRVPGLRQFAQFVYARIAANRHRLSRFYSREPKSEPPQSP